MHGYESWTVKKAERWRIDAFELWCWRRLLRVPWTARSSNQSIWKEISLEYSLERLILKLKLQYFAQVKSLSRIRLFATPWTVAHQSPLSMANSQSLLKLMPIESVMPSNNFILCRPLLLLPSIFPSIRVFSNESPLCIRWAKYRTSFLAQTVKRVPTMQKTRVRSLDREGPLEKEMAIHSSILAWRIPWTEEPGGLRKITQSRTWPKQRSLYTCMIIDVNQS